MEKLYAVGGLKDQERQLEVAQCNENENAGQLQKLQDCKEAQKLECQGQASWRSGWVAVKERDIG